MRTIALACLLCAPLMADAQVSADSFDTTRFGALRWRNLGPFRGGRAVAVAGVPGKPLLFYAGYTGAGLWRTEDAGNNWENISDCCFRMGSVGAIAVANSDPNVIYVGMGEHAVRGQSSSWGDGVYKSVDAGKSWRPVGLENTRQIAAVVVHPSNADVVFVAAQGTRWGPSADRGIYKSDDGGRSWRLVLHPSDSAGAASLSMDASNPRVLYASFWHGYRVPWQIRSGGTQGGVWKSTDAGETWTKLTNGLPRMMGKIGVAVSPADPDRVYAVVEADSGGMYRSDDAGATWRRVSAERRLVTRAWYYMNVVPDPKNRDVLYVMNLNVEKSIDGGRTWAILPARHSDNHGFWINPDDPDIMINANDGGVNVSLNGGRTWSTQNNQPTAQIYHLAIDDRFPYWVYGAQQDATTIAMVSATTGRGITASDWHPTAGSETAHIAFDPANPRFIYGGNYQGLIEEYDNETEVTRSIQAWPNMGLGQSSATARYRFNWSAPIASSPHDRRIIYHAGNVVFKTSDRGRTWTIISPDLTRDDPATQGIAGVPFTNDAAGGENYNTIFSIVESPHEAGTIYVGTDDGLVQLTRDGGRTWTNITPRGLPVGQVNELEVSPHDRATAYMVLYRVKWMDNAPYVYKTTDYGRTWVSIASNLPRQEAVRVVREDPRRRGTLYAGTETGTYVSFDGGTTWRSLQGNLPRVPVTDLRIKNDDIVITTEGRGFWVLDDTRPIALGLDSTRATRLFAPRDVVRRQYGGSGAPTAERGGQNPPAGATIYFYLSQAPDSAGVRVDIADQSGRIVRSFFSKRPVPIAGASATQATPMRQGLNRLIWDLRVDPPLALDIPTFFFGSIIGFRVAAGDYTVRLTDRGRTYTQPIKVLPDPRLQLTADDVRARQETALRIHHRMSEIFALLRDLRGVRDQVTGVTQFSANHPRADSIAMLSRTIRTRLDSLEQGLAQVRNRNSQDLIEYPPGVVDNLVMISNQVDAGETAPPRAVGERLGELDQTWVALQAGVRAVFERDIPALNRLLEGSAVVVPTRAIP